MEPNNRLQVIFRKVALYLVAFLQKETCNVENLYIFATV